MRVFELDNKDVTKILQPLQYLKEKVDLTLIRPERNATNTQRNMEEFLNNHHKSGRMVGYEIDYMNDETSFKFLTDVYKHESVEERLTAAHDSFGELDYPNTDFIEVADGKYYTVFDFQLSEDYWHPIQNYNNISGGDPLNRIITEMASKDHNLQFKFQVVAQPISKDRWIHRYPIPYVVKGLIYDYYKHTRNLFSGALSLFKTFVEERGRKDNFNDFLTNFFGGLKGLFTTPFKWLDGVDVNEYRDVFVDDADLDKAIENKVQQKGYVTNIRLVCIGDKKENVEEHGQDVANEIQNIYTKNIDKTDAPTKQGLVPMQKDKQWMLTEGANTVGRDRGVDFNGRFTDKQPRYYLRSHRRHPTILTPSELAGLMHIIQEEHPSIVYE